MKFSHDVIYEVKYFSESEHAYTLELKLKSVLNNYVQFELVRQTFDAGEWDRTGSDSTYKYPIDVFSAPISKYKIIEKYHKKDYPEYFL